MRGVLTGFVVAFSGNTMTIVKAGMTAVFSK